MEGFCNPVPRPKFLANGLDYEFFHHPVPRPKFLTNGFDRGVLPGWIRIPGSRPRSKKSRCLLKFLLKRINFLPRQGPWFSDGSVFWNFFLQSSPSAKISGQRTGLRFFSQSSPSAKISGQRTQRSKMKRN